MDKQNIGRFRYLNLRLSKHFYIWDQESIIAGYMSKRANPNCDYVVFNFGLHDTATTGDAPEIFRAQLDYVCELLLQVYSPHNLLYVTSTYPKGTLQPEEWRNITVAISRDDAVWVHETPRAIEVLPPRPRHARVRPATRRGDALRVRPRDHLGRVRPPAVVVPGLGRVQRSHDRERGRQRDAGGRDRRRRRLEREARGASTRRRAKKRPSLKIRVLPGNLKVLGKLASSL